MSDLSAATDAALAAERAYTEGLVESLTSQHAGDAQHITELTAALSDAEGTITALQARIVELEGDDTPPPPPPPAQKTALGTSMSKWPNGAAPREVARCYNDSDVTEAIAEKRRVLLLSAGSMSPAQAVSKVTGILARMRSAGIENPEVHFTEINEADRHITGATAIAAYLNKLRQHAAALASVPGASVWLNITREITTTSDGDPWKLKPSDDGLIGYAVNSYSPGRKKTPAVYTRLEDFIPAMLDWVKSTGITRFASWEFGTEVGGKPDTRPTTADNRADYIAAQVRFTVAEAAKRGIKVVALAYWNNIKQLANGSPDFSEPDNRLMNDEPKTSQALASALA